ncbi:5971_t:CDS:2 [Acaulospora colombiana]|uniref:5971_t:CDS:1 n=1 Tax=Acaulospora colombiana TaxID=27376 RepID=A0ACA9LUT5_9GLOM|nr:5971_t:CDS:2 [Acaulospora colombiana]
MAVSSSISISSRVASLPAPCLLSIFKNFTAEKYSKDLGTQRNLVLVNRHWCGILTPELWRDPFGYTEKKNDQHVKLIDTYFKCLPKDVGQKIIEEILEALNSNLADVDNGSIDDSSSDNSSNSSGKVAANRNLKPVFYYHKYLRNLQLDEIYLSVSKWYKKNVSKKVVSASTKGSQKLYLYRMILQNFVSHSSNIKDLTLTGAREYPYVNIYDLPQAESTLSSIRFLRLDVSSLPPGMDKMLREVIFSSSYFSTHIQELKINLNAEGDMSGTVEQLARLIESQRELKKISIECFEMDFQIIWKSVVNRHQGNLVKLNLECMDFQEELPFRLDSLKAFRNLEVLKITQCENFDFDENEIKDDADAFKKIRKLKLRYCTGIPTMFMKVLLQRAGNNLKDLKVNGLTCFAEILQWCTMYCHGLKNIETTLDKQHSELFIGLMRVNKDLRDISIDDIVYMESLNGSTSTNRNFIEDDDDFYFGGYSQRDSRIREIDDGETEDGNDFLEKMATVVPPYLRTFHFILDWWFTPKSLEMLLERMNAKYLKSLDFSRCRTFSEKHLNVVLKYCGGSLKRLILCISKNITREGLRNAKRKIDEIEFVEDEEKFCDEYLRDVRYGEELDDTYLEFSPDLFEDRMLEEALGFGTQHVFGPDLEEIDFENITSDYSEEEDSEDSDEESSYDYSDEDDSGDDYSDDDCPDEFSDDDM